MRYTVRAGDTLFSIARAHNLTATELMELNQLPAGSTLRIGQELTVARPQPSTLPEGFHLVRPGDTIASIARTYSITPQQLLQFNGLAMDATIFVGQSLRIRPAIATPQSTPQTNQVRETYTVRQGDTLFAISRMFNTTPEAILRMNNMQANASIFAGQQLVVREGITTAPPVAPTAPASTAPPPAPVSSPSAGTAGGGVFSRTYQVVAGDTLFAIARRFNTTPETILQLNGMAVGDSIRIGQVLQLPAPPPATSASAPTPTPAPPTPQPATATNRNTEVRHYTVRQGDTVLSISNAFGITPQQLLRMNNLNDRAVIFIGQQLVVNDGNSFSRMPDSPAANAQPGTRLMPYTVQSGDTLSRIGTQFGVTPAQILQANRLALDATIFVGQQLMIPVPVPVENVRHETHTVRPGEWMGGIADSFRTSTEEIVRANNLTSTRVNPGDQLTIPVPNLPPNIPAHLRERAQRFARERQIFQLEATSGEEIFGPGLRAPVGRSPFPIQADDLDKVQRRLVQLGILAANHTETVQLLHQRLRGRDILVSDIPQTVAAIERFQTRFRVDFWRQTPARIEMLGTDRFTTGLVEPNDLTFRVLREHTSYRLAFPHPLNPGETVVSEFRNFPISGHTVFHRGVGFMGNVLPDLPIEVYRSLGLDDNLALAVQYVSKHEGNFDAINSYDKAFFSFGFIQFAGNGGGLGAVIGNMKHRQPQLFEQYFQRFGIDVAFEFRNGIVHRGDLIVFDLQARNGQFEVRGIDAERAIQADPQLYGPFIRSAYDPRMCTVQIENAVTGYVRPALGIRLSIQVGSLNMTNIPLTDIINSPMGLGMAIDLTVNQWINRTRDLFKAAIERVAARRGLNTPERIRAIDEREVLQELIVVGGSDGRIRTRATSMLASSLSSRKSDGPVTLLA